MLTRWNEVMLRNQLLMYMYGVVSVTLMVTGTNGASFGEQCTSGSDCIDVNTECVRFRECSIGTCQCTSGYGNANGNACDKVLKHYNQVCDGNNICLDSNQECSSTTELCQCTQWNSYNDLAQACITVTRYVLTETCGGWWQLECYLNDTVGGMCDSVCQCKDGYTAATYIACRAPHYGEFCVYPPSCAVSFDTSAVSEDTSSDPPECLQNVCSCPPSHELKVVMGYNLCLNTVRDGYELKPDGDNCTHFNECQSSLCVKCLGSTTGVCMANDEIPIPLKTRSKLRSFVYRTNDSHTVCIRLTFVSANQSVAYKIVWYKKDDLAVDMSPHFTMMTVSTIATMLFRMFT